MDYSQYIRDAIISGRVLRVYYSDLNQPQMIVIKPLRWESAHRFSALISSSGDQWVFDVKGIQYCQSFASLDQALEYEKRVEQGSLQSPIAIPNRIHSNIPAWLQPLSNRLPVIKKITNGSEWNHLVTYYMKSIEQVWLRLHVIRLDQLHAFTLDEDLLGQFFKGKIGLGFVKNSQASDITTQFFAEYAERPGFQLCLGYPFIFFGLDQAAPLVYTRVNVSFEGQQIILQSGKLEVSASAARFLQVPVEEIQALLEPDADGIFLNPAQLVKFVLRKLGVGESSLVSSLTDAVGAKSIFQNPAMFWADLDQAENGLLRSLRAISAEAFWQAASAPLKALCTGVSKKDQRGSQAGAEWEFFPVTPASDEIRAAVEAGLVEALSVEILPEGKHRSDLVLNLTVQSFLAGHSVLIACRNSELADQILRRLENEAGFQGAIPFGKWPPTENETRLVRQAVDTAAGQTAASWGNQLQDLIKSRREFLHADEIIKKIQNLDGLKRVFIQQRDQLAPNLVDPWLGLSHRVLAHTGMQELLSELTELLTAVSDQNDRISTFRVRIRQVIYENVTGCAVIEDLKAWEMQTGSAGSGLFSANPPSTIAALQDYVGAWASLISENNTRFQMIEAQQSLIEAREQIAGLTEKLWSGLSRKIEPLADRYSEMEMAELSNRFVQLAEQFVGLIDRKPGLSEQLSVVSPLLSPMAKTVKAFDQEIHKLGLSWPPKARLETADAAAYAQAAGQMSVLTRAVACVHQFDRLEVLIKRLDEQSQTFWRCLPAEVQNLLQDYTPKHLDSGVLSQTFDQARKVLDRMESESGELIQRIHANLEENRLKLAVLTELWSLDEPGLAGMHLMELHPELQTVVEYLEAWINLVRILQLNGLIHEVEVQLAGLPSEADAGRLKDGPPQTLVDLNRKIFAASWLERTARLDQMTRQNALSFLDGLERSTQLPPESTQAALSRFEDAVRVFPVWVGTEWAARVALPLMPELFDLVIVDGADQIHLPGAISLLVRARKAVVVGASADLESTAWVDLAEDLALAKVSGIDSDAFSLKKCSLLNLAQCRLGKQAAPVSQDQAAVVVEKPSESVQELRAYQTSLLACLDSSREFIWWIDPDFNNDLINLFWDRLQQDYMIPAHEIRIITAVEQVMAPEDGSQMLHQNSLKALQAEMDEYGIHFEVRVLPKAAFQEMRFFFAKYQGLKMPSFPEVYRDRHQVSHFTLAEVSPELFTQYWDQADPLV